MQDQSQQTDRGTPWRRALAGVSALQAILVLVQASLAGQFLTGLREAVGVHRELGLQVITWIALAALVISIVWKVAGGPGWAIVVALISFLMVGFQIGVGFAHLLQVHIPLGVAIFGLNLWLAIRLTGKQWRIS